MSQTVKKRNTNLEEPASGEESATAEKILKIISGKTILNDADRANMEPFVKDGLPASVRGEFWNACTGATMF